MDKSIVFRKVAETISSTFSINVADIKYDTIAEDVPGWDSLSHTILMIRIGKVFGIRVPEDVAERAANVEDLVDGLLEHLS